jgi:uncharacterized protein YmfQ (DUF2313 family)
MATTSVKLEKYKRLIRGLFPTGWAWRFNFGSDFEALVEGLANEPCRIEERGFKFLDEMDPNTTFEMLDDWERLLGIPDECTPEDRDLSIFERRVRVLQKLTTGGGQNEDFYILVAQQLGYDIGVIDVEDFKDFRVGEARVGDALNNSTLPGGGGTSPAGWAFTWQIEAPAALTRQFCVGQSTVGERLVLFENEELECVIEKFKPAHTTVLFSFG